MPTPTLEKRAFLAQFGHEPDAIEKAGLHWENLLQILAARINSTAQLEKTAQTIADALKASPGVRTATYRVKDPERIINKILRKRITAATPENYRSHINDLIGVRALHLFKENWESIHEYIARSPHWKVVGEPEAKIRTGDLPRFQEAFLKQGCKVVADDEKGYRGVHYEVETHATRETAEIQVRSILEEAWSEVSHVVNYPSDTPNVVLLPYLNLFSRLTGIADEMATHMVDLRRNLSREKTVKEAVGRLEAGIKALPGTPEEKQKLLVELHFLREASNMTVSQVRFAGAEPFIAYRDELGPTILKWAAPDPADLAFETAVRAHKAARTDT